MFNAFAIEVQGLLDGTRELLKDERKTLTRRIGQLERQLVGRRAERDENAADRLRMKLRREAKLRRGIRPNIVRPAQLNAKLAKVERRLDANVPGICFGTHRLLRQQVSAARRHGCPCSGAGWLPRPPATCKENGDSRVTALCNVHAAYRGVVRER